MVGIEFTPELAKPTIPIENPQRRPIPEVPDPTKKPLREPQPIEPVKTPREPVPAGR